MDQKKIIEGVISAFTKEILSESKQFLGEVYDEGKVFLNIGVRNYLQEKYTKFYEIKTILKGNTPSLFYNVYYPLNVYTYGSKSVVVSTNKIDSIFKKNKNITIVGDGGSGKSTLTKHLFIQSLKEKSKIPIFFELRYYGDKNNTFNDIIFNIISNSEITNNKRIIKRLLKNGMFTFFLDGFDEIKSDKNKEIMKGISDFTSKYNLNNFVLTTRPGSGAENLQNFINYKICPLSNKNGDIDEFIDLQLKDELELAGKIKESVKSGELQYIKSFLRNPLLLSLYILTYQNNAEIPDKKYIFYRRVINSLYSEHDSKSKLGYVRDRRTNVSQENFEMLLKTFCFLAYFDGRYTFDKDYVISTLNLIKGKHEEVTFEAESFIYDMTVSISLWLDDAGYLSFSHRSLQEYFSALFIKDLVESSKKSIYLKLTSHAGKCRVLTEVENFLSLCEEMDTIYFYKYFYLPLTKEIYLKINNGDIKNKLRNFVLYFCYGIRIGYKPSKGKIDIRPLINKEVYKSMYIHLDYTKAINDEISNIPLNKLLVEYDEKDTVFDFENNEGLLDSVTDCLLENRQLKLINNFLVFLKEEIESKQNYIDSSIDSNQDLIDMI